jgi:hypothetical protein
VKTDIASRIGVLDALADGLMQVGRRPWLVIIPVVLDFGLWLAPQLSIRVLMQRFLGVWEALVKATYPPAQLAAMGDMLDAIQQAVTQLGAQLNLAEAVAGSWLAAPSALATAQATRLTFVSDMILAQVGLNLSLPPIAAASWRPSPVEITDFGAVVAVVSLLWLAGQQIVAVYLRWAAMSRPAGEAGTIAPREAWAGTRGLLGLALRLTAFSLLLGVLVLALRVPLGVAATLLLLAGNAVTGVLFALIGGVTLWLLLWFLTSLFFVSETLLLDREPLWRGVIRSIAMVRFNGLSTIGLVLVINLLMLGFRAVWGLMGGTPLGAIVAVLGNAYLATGMLLAVFVYYEDLRRRWQAHMAQVARQHRPLDKE